MFCDIRPFVRLMFGVFFRVRDHTSRLWSSAASIVRYTVLLELSFFVNSVEERQDRGLFFGACCGSRLASCLAVECGRDGAAVASDPPEAWPSPLLVSRLFAVLPLRVHRAWCAIDAAWGRIKH